MPNRTFGQMPYSCYQHQRLVALERAVMDGRQVGEHVSYLLKSMARLERLGICGAHVQERAQPQRRYAQIRELLAGASLDADVRQLAERIFKRLAAAESSSKSDRY